MKTDPLPVYGRDRNLWPSPDLNYAHTDGKILGIINNVKCCFLHDDAFLQRVKKTFLLTRIHLYLGTEQKRMDEDKSMQWGTWDRELCNLVLYSVRGNVICYKNNCKPRHVTIVGSQVWVEWARSGQRNVGSELSDLVTLHIPRQILVNREGAGDHTGHRAISGDQEHATMRMGDVMSTNCLVMSHYHVTGSQQGVLRGWQYRHDDIWVMRGLTTGN